VGARKARWKGQCVLGSFRSAQEAGAPFTGQLAVIACIRDSKRQKAFGGSSLVKTELSLVGSGSFVVRVSD
jgi:hypothetical protein